MSEIMYCPFCSEEIKATAIKCKHCKSDLIGPSGSASESNTKNVDELLTTQKEILKIEKDKNSGCLIVLVVGIIWYNLGQVSGC